MRTKDIIHRANTLARLAALAALLVLTGQSARAASHRDTVTIVCDWDFAPYEYINSSGESDGFCVEVLQSIMGELNIPYRLVMKSRKQGVEDFWSRRADLLIDYRDRFTGDGYCRSLNVLDYYVQGVAYREGMTPVSKLSQLADQHIVINSNNDTLLERMAKDQLACKLMTFCSPREALGGIASGQNDYFVFGIEPLKWKIKEYDLQNILISNLDIQSHGIRLVGHDQELVDEIDSQFARWQQSGKIDQISDKWFHPERLANRTSPYVKFVVLAVVLVAIFVFALYRLLKLRVQSALRHNEDMETMMRQALNMGKFTVMMYNLKQNHFTNQHGHPLPDGGVTREELMQRVHPDDRDAMLGRSRQMAGRPGHPHPFKMRWNDGTPEQPKWRTVQGYSYAELDARRRPENIVITSQDITGELKKEQDEREMTSRYMKMFDSTLLAMSFYDKDGNLVNLNDNMKKLCGLTEDNIDFFRRVKFYEIDMMKGDFDANGIIDSHFCQHMYYPEIGIDRYIEMRIHPTFDEKGALMYYIITSRDITDERSMYLELQNQQKALSETVKINHVYEKELRTLLENCDMYVWKADPVKRTISFSRSLHKDEFSETFDDYLSGISDGFREEAARNMAEIESYNEPFNVVHRFNWTPVTKTPRWFAVSGMPLRDAQGRLTTLFGLVRDVTDLMEAQQRLKEETARAENSALLKSTFLANMTHEIRTPLNAIVGFSDVLQMIDSADERREVIRIIRNNCDMLMRLVNDIIEASTIDVKPLDIKPHDVDFAAEFQVVCQSLAQRVQEPGVEFIVDAPYAMFQTTLDMGRMQQVVTNFVTNAVKYTHQGHIRVGYRYEDGGLYIYCEDTGTGIPKDKQARVFDRFVKLNDFVQGTGLGLSICKSIAERCNGRIGMESEGEGCGSTFWIWIPCAVRQMKAL